MAFNKIVHYFRNIPPIKTQAMSYLPAMDVTSLGKTLGLDLTK